MHGVDCQSSVEKSVLDEFLRVLLFLAVLKNDLFLARQVHVVHEHPDAALKFVQIDNLDDLVTVNEGQQARFVYNELLDRWSLPLQSDALESEEFAI